MAYLYGTANNTIVVNSEADLLPASGGEHPTVAGTTYKIGASITLSNSIRVEPGVSFISNNFFGPVLRTTSANGLFLGGDGSFRLMGLAIGAPNGKLFDFTDTTPLTSNVIMDSFACFEFKEVGTFTDIGGLNIANGVFFDLVNSTDGITMSGATIFGLGIRDTTIQTSDATLVGIDLGTTTASIMNFSNFNVTGVSGTVGIKGAAASANVITGAIANVANCTLNGGGATPLNTIGVDDIRWNFNGNAGITDTAPDALLSLTANATETTISSSGVPVKAAGTFVIERESQFTSDTTGKTTYNGEKSIHSPIDINATVVSASGTNKDVSVYLALNGTVIANSEKDNIVGSSDPKSFPISWQVDAVEDDFFEIFVENNTDTVNLIVTTATLRVL